jgi:transposase InsO family protein
LGIKGRLTAAQELIAGGIKVKRACEIVGLSSSTLYTPSQSAKAESDLNLIARLRSTARPGQGYRLTLERLRAAWESEHGRLNHKRVRRLWQQAGLGLKVKVKRQKRRSGAKVPCHATAPNQVWCVDFCYDACLNGQQLKILAVKDEYTRQCLALEVATSMKSHHVQKVLERLFQTHGSPRFVRSDNGSEFVAKSLSLWLETNGSASYFIAPGSPWQNGHAESFISRLRAECLDADLFCNLHHARLQLELYRLDYNQYRPHSALKYQTPDQFALALEAKKGNGDTLNS